MYTKEMFKFTMLYFVSGTWKRLESYWLSLVAGYFPLEPSDPLKEKHTHVE